MHRLTLREPSPHFGLLLILAALVGSAGCSGDSGEEASPTVSVTQTVTSATTSTEEATTTVEAGPSPEVLDWAETWQRRFADPLRKAAKKFVEKAPSAPLPGTAADFALRGPINKLLNCRLPLETHLSQTPAELRPVRRLSLSACRSAYLGVNKFTNGQNKASFAGYVTAESRALVDEGVARVKKGLRLLTKVEKAVARMTS